MNRKSLIVPPILLEKHDGGAAPQQPAVDELQARHGNSAVARAALAGSSDRGLPTSVRGSMEAAFGRSFSDVRVSEGERVRPGQLAVTDGGSIDFAPGQFQPETSAGRFLLAHELTHVVQQQNGGGAAVLAKADGSRAPSRPDLEREADEVASRIAGGGGGPVQVQGRVAPGEPVTLAFEAREHVLAAWEANKGWVQMGEFRIPWAFTVAMADLFNNVDEAQKIAKEDPEQFEAILSLKVAEPITHEEPGEAIDKKKGKPTTVHHPKLREALGEIDELLKVAAVDPGQFRGKSAKPGTRKTEGDFSRRIRKAVKKRYYKLASENIEHFLNPDPGDLDRSTLEKIERGQESKKLYPNAAGVYRENHEKALGKAIEADTVHPNAASGYRENHEKALRKAIEAGAARQSLDTPLVSEGWAAHFLSDSFSGGHIRSVRHGAAAYWDRRAPLFYGNMTGYIAEALSPRLNNLSYDILRPLLTWFLKDFPAIGGGLALGALPQHDLDNKRGVSVIAGGNFRYLKGDTQVDQVTKLEAAKAVRVSLGEVELAYRMGAEGKGFAEVQRALIKDGLYAAEHLIPSIVLADEQLTDPADRSVPWKNLTPEELFKDKIFQQGVARFLELKSADFSSVLSGVPGFVGNALQTTVLKDMAKDPAKLVWNILNWTPAGGGRARSVDYLHEVDQDNNLGTLTTSQRRRLVTSLVSERMTAQEANLLRSLLLMAPPGEAREIIRSLGAERLAKVLGPKFAELLSELPTR